MTPEQEAYLLGWVWAAKKAAKVVEVPAESRCLPRDFFFSNSFDLNEGLSLHHKPGTWVIYCWLCRWIILGRRDGLREVGG